MVVVAAIVVVVVVIVDLGLTDVEAVALLTGALKEREERQREDRKRIGKQE